MRRSAPVKIAAVLAAASLPGSSFSAVPFRGNRPPPSLQTSGPSRLAQEALIPAAVWQRAMRHFPFLLRRRHAIAPPRQRVNAEYDAWLDLARRVNDGVLRALPIVRGGFPTLISARPDIEFPQRDQRLPYLPHSEVVQKKIAPWVFALCRIHRTASGSLRNPLGILWMVGDGGARKSTLSEWTRAHLTRLAEKNGVPLDVVIVKGDHYILEMDKRPKDPQTGKPSEDPRKKYEAGHIARDHEAVRNGEQITFPVFCEMTRNRLRWRMTPDGRVTVRNGVLEQVVRESNGAVPVFNGRLGSIPLRVEKGPSGDAEVTVLGSLLHVSAESDRVFAVTSGAHTEFLTPQISECDVLQWVDPVGKLVIFECIPALFHGLAQDDEFVEWIDAPTFMRFMDILRRSKTEARRLSVTELIEKRLTIRQAEELPFVAYLMARADARAVALQPGEAAFAKNFMRRHPDFDALGAQWPADWPPPETMMEEIDRWQAFHSRQYVNGLRYAFLMGISEFFRYTGEDERNDYAVFLAFIRMAQWAAYEKHMPEAILLEEFADGVSADGPVAHSALEWVSIARNYLEFENYTHGLHPSQLGRLFDSVEAFLPAIDLLKQAAQLLRFGTGPLSETAGVVWAGTQKLAQRAGFGSVAVAGGKSGEKRAATLDTAFVAMGRTIADIVQAEAEPGQGVLINYEVYDHHARGIEMRFEYEPARRLGRTAAAGEASRILDAARDVALHNEWGSLEILVHGRRFEFRRRPDGQIGLTAFEDMPRFGRHEIVIRTFAPPDPSQSSPLESRLFRSS